MVLRLLEVIRKDIPTELVISPVIKQYFHWIGCNVLSLGRDSVVANRQAGLGIRISILRRKIILQKKFYSTYADVIKRKNLSLWDGCSSFSNAFV